MAKQNYNIINRLKNIRRKLKAQRAGALLVTDEHDARYLSGFTGDSSWLVVGEKFTCLITDGRYDEQARAQCADIEIIVRDGAMIEAFMKSLKGRGVRSVGFQADKMTVAVRDRLAKALGSRKLKPTTGLVAELRMVKDESEIKLIRKGGQIAQNAFLELISRGGRYFVGKTEREIAAELIYLLRYHGAEAEAFAPIVAAGANGSMPHYEAGNVKIKKGDPVLFDWGACHKGYRSDLTRVVFIGTIPPEIQKLYPVVLRAQKAGMKIIKPGLSCRAADKAAREIICDAGYAQQFSHSLGHGIGLDVHEGPTLSGLSSQRLRKGMVVTVEPGIYVPKVGGVRIEDDIVVTADSSRRITNLKSDIDSMVI